MPPVRMAGYQEVVSVSLGLHDCGEPSEHRQTYHALASCSRAEA
jgi:hypothetical protein